MKYKLIYLVFRMKRNQFLNSLLLNRKRTLLLVYLILFLYCIFTDIGLLYLRIFRLYEYILKDYNYVFAFYCYCCCFCYYFVALVAL